jgi:hypothetical protein
MKTEAICYTETLVDFYLNYTALRPRRYGNSAIGQIPFGVPIVTLSLLRRPAIAGTLLRI